MNSQEKEGKRKWQWLRGGLKPTTWQMACHALTNWATESLGNLAAEFEYLRLTHEGSSWSRYQAGMSDGEGVVSAKRGTCSWVALDTIYSIFSYFLIVLCFFFIIISFFKTEVVTAHQVLFHHQLLVCTFWSTWTPGSPLSWLSWYPLRSYWS